MKDIRAKARIDIRIRRLSLGNPGDVKPVGKGVSELRVDVGKGYRICPGLFMNAGAPSLVHLPTTNSFSVVRKHSYGLYRKNPLRTNVLRDHQTDS